MQGTTVTNTEVLLAAATANPDPLKFVKTKGYRNFTVTIAAEDVSTGGTVNIWGGLFDDPNVLTGDAASVIHAQAISVNTTNAIVIQFNGPFEVIFATLDVTDGTYTVVLSCQD